MKTSYAPPIDTGSIVVADENLELAQYPGSFFVNEKSGSRPVAIVSKDKHNEGKFSFYMPDLNDRCGFNMIRMTGEGFWLEAEKDGFVCRNFDTPQNAFEEVEKRYKSS